MGSIGRRRRVLVEKLLPSKIHKRENQEAFRPLITPFIREELFVKNRFVVELEMSDGLIIDTFRVRGFKIESTGGDKKIFKVRTYLHVKEWLSDYEKVAIARVSLLDPIGNEINTFDLDLRYDGYAIECDYNSDGFMTPCFTYVIVGE